MSTKNIPCFGDKVENVHYITRRGTHAVITRPDDPSLSANEVEICLLQTPNGAYYLPGGEIEAGENQETALARELMEELGATAEIETYLGQADEYYYSSHRDQHFYNPAYIYICKHAQLNHAPLEAGNNICWFSIDEAIEKVKRGSHKWGLEQYKLAKQ